MKVDGLHTVGTLEPAWEVAPGSHPGSPLASRSTWLRQALAPSITTRVGKDGCAPPHALTVLRNVPWLPSSCAIPSARLSSGTPVARTVRTPRSRPNKGARGPDVKGYPLWLLQHHRGGKLGRKSGSSLVHCVCGQKLGDAPTYRCAAKIPPKINRRGPKGAVQQWPNRSRLGRATEPKGGSEYPPRRLPQYIYLCICAAYSPTNGGPPMAPNRWHRSGVDSLMPFLQTRGCCGRRGHASPAFGV